MIVYGNNLQVVALLVMIVSSYMRKIDRKCVKGLELPQQDNLKRQPRLPRNNEERARGIAEAKGS